MKILFLSRWFPYPLTNGSKVRIYNLLRILAAQHKVTLLSFNDEPEKSLRLDELESICENIITFPWKYFEPTSAKSILGLFSPKPRSVIDTFSPDMAHGIQKILSDQKFDTVIASQIEMASYQKYFYDQIAIFDEIEIGVPLERFLKGNNQKDRIRSGITWFKHKQYLKRLLRFFPVCTVTSTDERNLLYDYGIRSENVFIVPNFIDWVDYQDYARSNKTNSIIFTGSFRYQPNYEAMLWFLEKIFPMILEAIPDVQLIITGDHLNLPLPHKKNVTTTGFVDDIRPLIAQGAVSIVPLLSGGGTRLKILEAMALKTPVVSTSKGAQGISVMHGKNILLADTPKNFSEAVIRILRNKSLGVELANQGFSLIKELYSPEAILKTYENILEKARRLEKENHRYQRNI